MLFEASLNACTERQCESRPLLVEREVEVG
jgi:hypothetical protein